MHYVVIGSAISGNKGAASMLEATIEGLRGRDAKARFTLLSMYPEEDRALSRYDDLDIVDASVLRLGIGINTAAVLWRALPPARRLIERAEPALATLARADVLIDQGGITFSDGREKFLLYNVASILPALVAGVPVVKCAQAMGPFEGRANRLVARLVLPRVHTIVSRGHLTSAHLATLSLDNVVEATDIAFCLDDGGRADSSERPDSDDRADSSERADSDDRADSSERADSDDRADGEDRHREDHHGVAVDPLVPTGPGPLVGIAPSVVVRRKAEARDIDYVSVLAELVERQVERGNRVLIVPHSFRTGTLAEHNNDGPLVAGLGRRIGHLDGVTVVGQELDPVRLRRLIGRCDVFLACRFHAMVSSLAEAVPTLVVGWSHKYREILDRFAMGDACLDVTDMEVDVLDRRLTDLLAEADERRSRLRAALPDVRRLAERNFDAIGAAAASTAGS